MGSQDTIIDDEQKTPVDVFVEKYLPVPGRPAPLHIIQLQQAFKELAPSDKTSDGTPFLHVLTDHIYALFLYLQMRSTERKPLDIDLLHQGYTILYKLTFDAQDNKATQLLKFQPTVDIANYAGATPLHMACVNGDVVLAGKLINQAQEANARGASARLLAGAAKAYVDMATKEGKTPLMLAAFACNLPLVELLLKNGAAATAIDSQGRTALHYLSLRKGHFLRSGDFIESQSSPVLHDDAQPSHNIAGRQFDPQDMENLTFALLGHSALVKDKKGHYPFSVNLDNVPTEQKYNTLCAHIRSLGQRPMTRRATGQLCLTLPNGPDRNHAKPPNRLTTEQKKRLEGLPDYEEVTVSPSTNITGQKRSHTVLEDQSPGEQDGPSRRKPALTRSPRQHQS